jgi:3-oxoacyl-[acyl-carrier protein] reductase
VRFTSDGYDRLTQAKEEGATIEIDGKKVALGIPGTGPGANQPGPKAYPLIPLARGASPDEAANGMLL